MSSRMQTRQPPDECVQPWIDENCEVYSGTATGYLGTKRPTMLDNALLHRNTKLGTVPKFFTAPSEIPKDFTYGDNYRDFFNMGHALTGWSSYLAEAKRLKPQKPVVRVPDFLSMNRAAVSNGVTNAKELRDFRDTHEIVTLGLDAHRIGEVRPKPAVIDKNKTYARPTGPRENMHRLLSTHFQDEWIKNNSKKIAKANADKEFMEPKKHDFTKYYQNRTCDLRNFMCKTGVEIKEPLWQMPKFSRYAKPALCTFRSEAAADKAWKNYGYDRVGRDGVQGSGIPTKAQNVIDWEHCPQVDTQMC